MKRDESRIEEIYQSLGANEKALINNVRSGFIKNLLIGSVGQILQHVVIDLTSKGLGTCWIGPGADHESIISSLGDRYDGNRDNIICLLAVGYHSRYIPLMIRIFNRKMRKRLPLNHLFFEDQEMRHRITDRRPAV